MVGEMGLDRQPTLGRKLAVDIGGEVELGDGVRTLRHRILREP